MNKKIKKQIFEKNVKMRAAFPNLYDNRWVEKAADEGFRQLVKGLKNIDPKLGELAESKGGYNVFAIIYYSSFEDALNTFFAQCLDDSITKVTLLMDELQKVTASIESKTENKND